MSSQSRGDCPERSDRRGRTPFSAIADPSEKQAAHIVDMLGFCGHWLHFKGGGRSGSAPILRLLSSRGGQLAQRELMESFELKAGSLSEVLSKLERQGLIERTRDEQDRRQLIVRLTELGSTKAAEERERRKAFLVEGLSCLDTDERSTLEDLLERITNHWRTLDD